jgi:hypothetical protein
VVGIVDEKGKGMHRWGTWQRVTMAPGPLSESTQHVLPTVDVDKIMI